MRKPRRRLDCWGLKLKKSRVKNNRDLENMGFFSYSFPTSPLAKYVHRPNRPNPKVPICPNYYFYLDPSLGETKIAMGRSWTCCLGYIRPFI